MLNFQLSVLFKPPNLHYCEEKHGDGNNINQNQGCWRNRSIIKNDNSDTRDDPRDVAADDAYYFPGADILCSYDVGELECEHGKETGNGIDRDGAA